MKVKRLFLLLLPLLLFSGSLLAQEKQVSGKVTDSTGTPIANASVVLKGSGKGTVTSTNGMFSFKVPTSASTLVVTYVGFETQEAAIGNGPVNVSLRSSNTSLGAVTVVAIGYGTLEKREVSSAVTHISGKELLPVGGNGALCRYKEK